MRNEVGLDFMERTTFKHAVPSDQMQDLPQPPLELPYDIHAKMITLPDPNSIELKRQDLRRIMVERRSIREYAPDPMNLDILSFLLWASQGVEQMMPGHTTLRTVPSAGARHAFETYLAINQVEGLEPALYRYIATRHELVALSERGDIAGRLSEACLNQSMITTCAVVFIWTAVPYRMTWRYGQRGYRYLHLDAGHVCQNLYLASESVGCGACAIAAFDDDAVNQCLGINGTEQFVIYLATVGIKAAV